MTSTDQDQIAVNRPPRRRVYLVRHGEVSYFGRASGAVSSEQVPLNDTGHAQAEALAAAMADVPLDAAVSSDLLRCRQTAASILKRHPIEPNAESALREIRPGAWSELAGDGIEEQFIRAFRRELTPEHRFLSGETFGEMLARVLPWLDAMLARGDWRHLLVVAHGGVNRAILTRALGSGLRGFGALEQDNACLNIIDFDPSGEAIVRLINFTPYNVTKHGLEHTTMERLYLQYRQLIESAGGD